MKENPLVSVIIPTYKRSETLTRAIDSVLEQTYPSIEIIVVDDNGEGTEMQLETEKALENYIISGEIVYIKHEVNRNGSAARNTGFKKSHGIYVVFLDDDDYFKPENVSRKVEALQGTNEEIGGVFSTFSYLYVDRKGKTVEKPTHYYKEGNVLKDFLTGKAEFNTSGILFKKSAILSLNGFDESFRRHQDFELMIRFFRVFKLKLASTDPQYFLDLTSEGPHAKVISDRFKFEREFLEMFKEDLTIQNCYHAVSHYLYYSCCLYYLGVSDLRNFTVSFIYSLRSGLFSLNEIKGFIRVIVRKVFSGI